MLQVISRVMGMWMLVALLGVAGLSVGCEREPDNGVMIEEENGEVDVETDAPGDE